MVSTRKTRSEEDGLTDKLELPQSNKLISYDKNRIIVALRSRYKIATVHYASNQHPQHSNRAECVAMRKKT